MTDAEWRYRIEAGERERHRKFCVDQAVALIHMFYAIRGERCPDEGSRCPR